uniref:Major facilitator superfamily associated domain-containing protein n=2 Tax=Homalodisca liturata TaxID=320908 RepID=A0A1B6JI39_9HEMI
MSPVNFNLVSLKCLLFFFFGGLGCLVPGLAQAGYKVGLHVDELYVVSVVAPCVALLGPLIAAPLADRLGVPAQGSTARYGRYMRAMLVIITLLGAVLYTALLYVPPVSRLHERNPPVSFLCSGEGAVVMQDQCQEIPCYNWPEDNRGTLFLSACRHVCGEGAITPGGLYTTTAPPETITETRDDDDYGELSAEEGPSDVPGLVAPMPDSTAPVEMPRLCFDHNGQSVCHVYTEYTKQLPINVTLTPSLLPKDTLEWCSYKILDKITCKQPSPPDASTAQLLENCSVVCDLDDPYNRSESLLIESECRHTLGDPQLTFWTFLVLRSVADIFPTTALALLASCLVVAARDTPALLCRQLMYAALGYAFVPPLVDFVVDILPEDPITDKHLQSYGYHIITFAILSVISAVIILFDRSLPLSPVDYHLHSGPGHLTLRGAGGEIGALSLVLILLGLLSSAIDSYIPWESVVLALIPSLLVLWYSEKVVDYCGHSNILIVAFTFYIIRYTGLLICEEVWGLFLFGALEVFTLVLSWSTAILYLRHLVPRHILVTGQALAIIAFFCIGRCLGSVMGGVLLEHIKNPSLPKWNDYYSETLYETGAVLSAVIASLYFILYHFCLKHKWRKQNNKISQPVVQDTNANGTYTPLKIYNQPVKDQRIRY